MLEQKMSKFPNYVMKIVIEDANAEIDKEH